MRKNVKNCLLEALRRYHSFHAGESPVAAWTGLGTPSEYRDVVALGYMVPTAQTKPRIAGWYRLTEQGVAVLLLLANEGYRAVNYSIQKGA